MATPRQVIPIHDALSPSASGRWLNCAGSVEANSGRLHIDNVYADEGTAAHNLFELCIRLGTDPDKHLGKVMYKTYKVTDDMTRAVRIALDYLHAYVAVHKRKNPKLDWHAERRTNINSVTGRDDTNGTADLTIDNWPEEFVVFDYKHGKGVVVEVADSTQAQMYLLDGVPRKYKQYRAVIGQPRAPHEEGPVREFVYTHEEMLAFAEHVKERAALTDVKNPVRTAGDWCRDTFCGAQARCRTLRMYAQKKAGIEFTPIGVAGITEETMAAQAQDLSNKELADIILSMPVIESFFKACYAEALREMVERRRKVPGLKPVLGRTQRMWKDERAIAKALHALGLTPDQIAPRHLVGIGDAEKLVRGVGAMVSKKAPTGGTTYEFPVAIQKHVGRTLPTLHVAPATDPRPAYTQGQEFKPIE